MPSLSIHTAASKTDRKAEVIAPYLHTFEDSTHHTTGQLNCLSLWTVGGSWSKAWLVMNPCKFERIHPFTYSLLMPWLLVSVLMYVSISWLTSSSILLYWPAVHSIGRAVAVETSVSSESRWGRDLRLWDRVPVIDCILIGGLGWGKSTYLVLSTPSRGFASLVYWDWLTD